MEWVKKEENYRVPVKSWCNDMDEGALHQAEDLAMHPKVYSHVAIMPDAHKGYGMPIGGVIGCLDAVIPNAVGVDIGCGMGAVKTSIKPEETDMQTLRKIVTSIKKLVPCGEGKSHRENQGWEGLEPDISAFTETGWYSKKIAGLAGKNLGTLGGGNHFIEIQKGDDGFVWLMIHSGSRNLGYMIASYYNKLAITLNETWSTKIPSKDLAFLPADSQEGQDYIRDMTFALNYAKENRRKIMMWFKQVISAHFPEVEYGKDVNIHHNYAALENHFGKNLWVHRKGATSAKKGETGIIPGSMGTPSYIVEGLGNPDSFTSCSHGAGRKMGRMQASRILVPEECDKKMEGIVFDRWKKQRKGKGNGTLDLGEAPQAYKDIESVIDSEADLVKPVVKLHPIAVVKG